MNSPFKLVQRAAGHSNRYFRYVVYLAALLLLMVFALLWSGNLQIDLEADGLGPLNAYLVVVLFMLVLLAAIYFVMFTISFTIECLSSLYRAR